METIKIDMGNKVYCDYCSEDYTDSDKTGGMLVGSYACCPKCKPDMLSRLKQYDEEKYIKDQCPDYIPFSEWVRTCLR